MRQSHVRRRPLDPAVDRPHTAGRAAALAAQIAGWIGAGRCFVAGTGHGARTGTEQNWLGGGPPMWRSHADAATNGALLAGPVRREVSPSRARASRSAPWSAKSERRCSTAGPRGWSWPRAARSCMRERPRPCRDRGIAGDGAGGAGGAGGCAGDQTARRTGQAQQDAAVGQRGAVGDARLDLDLGIDLREDLGDRGEAGGHAALPGADFGCGRQVFGNTPRGGDVVPRGVLGEGRRRRRFVPQRRETVAWSAGLHLRVGVEPGGHSI